MPSRRQNLHLALEEKMTMQPCLKTMKASKMMSWKGMRNLASATWRFRVRVYWTNVPHVGRNYWMKDCSDLTEMKMITMATSRRIGNVLSVEVSIALPLNLDVPHVNRIEWRRTLLRMPYLRGLGMNYSVVMTFGSVPVA